MKAIARQFDRAVSICLTLFDQVIPTLPARSIAKEIRAAVVDDVLGDVFPGDLGGGEIPAPGLLVDGLPEEVYLVFGRKRRRQLAMSLMTERAP